MLYYKDHYQSDRLFYEDYQTDGLYYKDHYQTDGL